MKRTRSENEWFHAAIEVLPPGTGVALTLREGASGRRMPWRVASGFRGMEAPGGRVSRRILVVDDDRPSREGLSTALVREGHSVDSAADAWQAIVRLRAQSFDIAVIDLDLPAVHGVDLGGWDVVRIARAYQPDIALIVLSADEDPAQGIEAHALGVTDILGKPISLRELTGLVETARPLGGLPTLGSAIRR